jgi:hypothetical protein
MSDLSPQFLGLLEHTKIFRLTRKRSYISNRFLYFFLVMFHFVCPKAVGYFNIVQMHILIPVLNYATSGRGLCGAGPGPGSTDNVPVWAGFGPGSNNSSQTLYRKFRAFSGHFFFAKRKVS